MAGFRISDTGVHTPSVEEAISDAIATLQAIFGDDLELNPQTPQLQLAGAQAISDIDYGESLNALYNAISPDRATGGQLDDYGAVLNINRRQATHSRLDATLTGTPGTSIPAGSRARTADGDEFKTDSDTVLTSTGVTVSMTAVNSGKTEVAAGALNQIVNVIDGWETVTNPEAATVGRDAETDASYRATYLRRTARVAVGPVDAVRAALDEAGADQQRVVENNDSDPATVQQFHLKPHALLVVAQEGTAADLTRAIEAHRGMGTPTMTAIFGGTPDNAALDNIGNGTITWEGVAYKGLNLTAAKTAADKAAALTALLPNVTVSVINGRYVAQFGWHPDRTHQFGTGTAETGFGLTPTAAIATPGPFIRPTDRPLAITVNVTRQDGFPADGFDQIRTAIRNQVAGYPLGGTVYLNDLLTAAQNIPGTQVTAITATHASTNVSGVAPPFNARWTVGTLDVNIA